MNKLILHNFNLHWTLLGGQAFNWDFEKETNTFWGYTQDKVIELKIVKEERGLTVVFWQTYPLKDDFKFLSKYLRLSIDYQLILEKIDKDVWIHKAIENYPNLRILHQDFEQTFLSFILSSTKNIPAIRKSIRDLSYRFGEKIIVKNKEFYLFPKTEKLAETQELFLRETKIGFRAKYFKKAAQILINSDLTSEIALKNESDARKKLIQFEGVGNKIADCTLVFALQHDNVNPLDVWSKKVLVEFYHLSPGMKYEEMRAWSANYFDGYAAWAGQFLFEYVRNLK